jgi:hypothetical protein
VEKEQSMHNRIRVLLCCVTAALFLIACNLTRTPPTPTLAPTLSPTRPGAPTLFASITPLPGGGGNPGGGTVPTLVPPSNCPPPTGWVQYVVQEGDSLEGLASATGSTTQQLAGANCIADPNTLFSGQVIYLPRSPISG